jgi:hypothetical protein
MYMNGINLLYLYRFGDTLEIENSIKLVCYQVCMFCCLPNHIFINIFLAEFGIFCIAYFIISGNIGCRTTFSYNWKQWEVQMFTATFPRKRKGRGYILYISMFSRSGFNFFFSCTFIKYQIFSKYLQGCGSYSQKPLLKKGTVLNNDLCMDRMRKAAYKCNTKIYAVHNFSLL